MCLKSFHKLRNSFIPINPMKKKLEAQWLDAFDVILFDLDGLLIDTEKLHFKAYCQAFREMGYVLNWSFSFYCQKALLNTNSLRDSIFELFPSIQQNYSVWEEIRKQKTMNYLQIIQSEEIEFLPGVEELIQVINEREIECCVVTNSLERETALIRKRLPQLDMIPLWVTRESYAKPKPFSDCYKAALKFFANKNINRMLGFEDSIRGIAALESAGIPHILICPSSHLSSKDKVRVKNFYFESFEALPCKIGLKNSII